MIETRLLSSLEKVFLDEAPCEKPLVLSALTGETIAFQLAFRDEAAAWRDVAVTVESPLGKGIRLRQVQQVPVRMANYPDGDGDTLRSGAPGLYPDLLTEVRLH